MANNEYPVPAPAFEANRVHNAQGPQALHCTLWCDAAQCFWSHKVKGQ